jgi:hypothetical protein
VKILIVFLMTTALMFGVSTWALADAPVQRHEEMLYTATLIRVSTGSGSGTVIYSAERAVQECEEAKEDGDDPVCIDVLDDDGVVQMEWHTYLLTNHHVISGAVKINKEFDPQKGEKVDVERRLTVDVEWFEYNEYSRHIGTRGKKAEIVAYDKAADIAILRVKDRERGVAHVAYIIPEDASIYLTDTVYAVGAGLGRPPFMTSGELGFIDEEINGYRYMLATAPIIFGNSGGALYRFSDKRGRYELIGVPSRVSAAGFTIVSHMGWIIPIETVVDVLRNNYLEFIIDGNSVK